MLEARRDPKSPSLQGLARLSTFLMRSVGPSTKGCKFTLVRGDKFPPDRNYIGQTGQMGFANEDKSQRNRSMWRGVADWCAVMWPEIN